MDHLRRDLGTFVRQWLKLPSQADGLAGQYITPENAINHNGHIATYVCTAIDRLTRHDIAHQNQIGITNWERRSHSVCKRQEKEKQDRGRLTIECPCARLMDEADRYGVPGMVENFATAAGLSRELPAFKARA